MLSAGPTAPVAQWSPALATMIDEVLTALSQAIPDRIPAGSREDVGGVKVFSAPTSPRRWYHSASCSGGWGALPYRDGVCGMKSLNHGDSKILPAEVIEATDPILIEEETLTHGFRRRRASSAAAWARRAPSACCEDGIGAFSMHRATCPPWGLFGGEPGAPDMFHFEIPGRAPFSEPKLENVPLPTRLGRADGDGGRRRLGQPARRATPPSSRSTCAAATSPPRPPASTTASSSPPPASPTRPPRRRCATGCGAGLECPGRYPHECSIIPDPADKWQLT